MWINPCAQVIFDSDPAPKDISGPAAVDMMSQAMIRCLQHTSGVKVDFNSNSCMTTSYLHLICSLQRNDG